MRIDLQDRINRASQITEKSAHYPFNQLRVILRPIAGILVSHNSNIILVNY
jgi:hypothetical protein